MLRFHPRGARSLSILCVTTILLTAADSGCKKKTPAAVVAVAREDAAVIAVPSDDASTSLAPTKPITVSNKREVTREGSAIVLTTNHHFVADEDVPAIITLSNAGEFHAFTKLAGRPGQMLVTRDGRLAVALRDEHVVAFFGQAEDGTLIERQRVPVADEPVGLARIPASKSGEKRKSAGNDNDDLIVSVSAIGHALCIVDPKKGTAPARCIDLARDPRGVTVSDDGATAIVSHASADGASIVTLETGAVRTVDLGRPRFEKKIMPDGFQSGEIRFQRFARHAFAAIHLPRDSAAAGSSSSDSSDGGAAAASESERVVVPHALVAPGDRESFGNGYGSAGGSGSTFTFDETMTIFPTIEVDVASLAGPVFDVERTPTPAAGVKGVNANGNGNRQTGQGICFTEVMDADTRCLLPRAAAAASASQFYVACVGSSDVQRFDIEKSRVMKQPARYAVAGGPTAVAISDADTLFAFSQHDRSISIFENAKSNAAASPNPTKPTRIVKLDTAVPATTASARVNENSVRRGRALFHASLDTRISKDRRACATCHPDGRDDGLVWTSPEGFRQTIFLAGRLDRKSPYGWHGKHASIRDHLKVTLRNLLGTGLPDDAIADLEAYVRAIPPPPRASRPLSTEATEGKRIFSSSETRCSTCHAESQGFGGMKAENVSSAVTTDTVKEFLVPSLRFIGASAPYYHDGRFPTLEELIRSADGKMGHTNHLSDTDVSALTAYLKTL